MTPPRVPINKRRILEWTAAQVARADYFVVSLFLGQGKYARRRAATLDEARVVRGQLAADYATLTYGQRPVIYCVTKGDSLTIHVE